MLLCDGVTAGAPVQEILGTVVMGPWGQDILHTEGQDAQTLEHMLPSLWVRQS